MEQQRGLGVRVKAGFTKFCKPLLDVLNNNNKEKQVLLDRDTIVLLGEILSSFSNWAPLIPLVSGILNNNDINYQHNGSGILHEFGILYGCDLLFAKLLQVPGIDVNARNLHGMSPLMLLVKNGMCRNVCVILKNKDIDLNALQLSTGHSALSKSLEYVYINIACNIYNDERVTDLVKEKFLIELLNLYNSILLRQESSKNRMIRKNYNNISIRIRLMMRTFATEYSRLGLVNS